MRVFLISIIVFFAGCEDSTGDSAVDVGVDAGIFDASVDVEPDAAADPIDRQAGERGPRNLRCDPMDAYVCVSPWPNNAFAVAASTPTGIRLAVHQDTQAPGDTVEALNSADGFSTLSTLTVTLEGTLDPTTLGGPYDGAIQLRLAQAGPDYGQEVPLRILVETRIVEGMTQSLLVAHPLRPLRHDSDYVVVVNDKLKSTSALQADVLTKAALDLIEPTTIEQFELRAYHAPTRLFLRNEGINPAKILRVWDFTTRSAANMEALLPAMMATSVQAVKDDAVTVVVDKVFTPTGGDIALIVEGRLEGLPDFLVDDALNPSGPTVQGTTSSPFRVLVPTGTGDYHAVMYGHGTGGQLNDPAFDTTLAGLGVGKVSLQWTGWTEAELPLTAIGLNVMLQGSWRSTSKLLVALAHGAAIQEALNGVIGDLVSADEIDGIINPAAGRRPDMNVPVWTGGSMGGTLGFVYTLANPTIHHAVLNVPGAAWTHWIPDSETYKYFELILKRHYPSRFEVIHGIAIAQILWDPIDGGAYPIPDGYVALIQESIGDPILPNAGTNMVATALGAVHIGEVLLPIVDLESAERAAGITGITQYKVASDDALDIHGFGGGSSPAGVAARSQILAFVESVWAGAPLIETPMDCVDASCDFSN
jgi:hypothetical protein